MARWESEYFWYSEGCSKAPPPKAFLILAFYRRRNSSTTTLAGATGASVLPFQDMDSSWLRRQPLIWFHWTKHSLALSIYKNRRPLIRSMDPPHIPSPWPNSRRCFRVFLLGMESGLWYHDSNHSIQTTVQFNRPLEFQPGVSREIELGLQIPLHASNHSTSS